MDEYKCEKCGKEFSKKKAYNRHKNMKSDCSIRGKRECTFCGTIYSRSSYLFYHMMVCEKNPNKITIEEMRKIKIDNMQSKTNNNSISNNIETNNGNIENNIVNCDKMINNNNINIENVEIKITPYGHEDLSKIPDEEIKKMIKAGFQCVPKIVEYVHFNEDTPENHNIYKSNLRDNKLLTYNGKKWVSVPLNDTLEDLYNKNADFLVGKFHKLKDQISDIACDRFTRYIDKYETKKCFECVKDPLILLMYNNKDMIKK